MSYPTFNPVQFHVQFFFQLIQSRFQANDTLSRLFEFWVDPLDLHGPQAHPLEFPDHQAHPIDLRGLQSHPPIYEYDLIEFCR